MRYKNFEELPIWQKAREIVKLIYSLTSGNDELKKDYRFIGQLRAAGLSIMNNIAEGFDSDNVKEFKRFLMYAQRSASEVMSMTYVLIDAYKIKDGPRELYEMVLEERRQLKGFIKYLNSLKSTKSQKATN